MLLTFKSSRLRCNPQYLSYKDTNYYQYSHYIPPSKLLTIYNLTHCHPQEVINIPIVNNSILSPCQVDNFICICQLFDLTSIDDHTGREGFCYVPTQMGGDILPTPPCTPYTPLPPTYPPSPSVYFGGQKGGIILS